MLRVAVAEVLDDGVREAGVELAVLEGQVAPVGLTRRISGKASAKCGSSSIETAVIRSRQGYIASRKL